MIDLVDRHEWGARVPRSPHSTLASTRGVKVHYTGGHVDLRLVEDHDRCVSAVRDIQRHHIDGNGWSDIGYTLVVCPHRKVFVGRGPRHLPAANGPGMNAGHYAVLGLVGNSGLVEPADEMLHGILDGIEYLREHGGAGREIKGHRDGYTTACPGPSLYAWVKEGAPRPGQAPVGAARPGDAPPAWPGRLLEYPPIARGDDVRVWQAHMRELGYDIEVDGAYGPDSVKVAIRFQTDHQLDPDGVVGPLTWRAAWQGSR